MIDQIKKLSGLYSQEIIDIRRHLHKHPELSFKEYKTSSYIKSILKKWEISFQDNIANTGLVAFIKGKNSSESCVAVRADMDALPIVEENKVNYSSVHNGVMHACGHDVHTASVLGAIKILNELKDQWKGTIKFIFQPAEERLPGGAKAMIEQGVLESPYVQKVLAQHVFPDLEVGKVGFKPGRYMAAIDGISIVVKGKGGHAAIPEQYNNPIVAASDLILSLQSLFNEDSEIPSVFAIGFVSAEGASNIIPETVSLEGTFRSVDSKMRKDSHVRISEKVKYIESKYSLEIELKINKGYPFLENDIHLTQNCMQFAKEYLGEENVVELPVRMTSEDFAYFTKERPSCFYRLGTRNEKKGIVHGLHTSRFDIDEDAIKLSIGLMSFLLLQNLGN